MGIIRIAVDAMGGDFAPAEIVTGAVQGARELDIAISLVGEPAAVEAELEKNPAQGLGIEIVPAVGVIRMEEDPSLAVRSRPEASINVACRLVMEGRADGVLTMGHTGAGAVAALLNFGRIHGVERPAALVPFLGLREDLFLIDAGANSDVRPPHLLQFARMGAAYAEHVAGIPNPRVGLLSNGAEPNKGNKTGKEAFPLLAGAAGLNFIGNVEANSLLSGTVNVIVADGFSGNLLLKAAEGLVAEMLAQFDRFVVSQEELPAGLAAGLETIKARTHYSRYGVATLLGVQQPVFIGHGRSRALAVRNGLATAARAISADIVGKILEGFGE